MILDNRCAALILAAGKSQRMGASKLMLEYAEGLSILNQIITLYKDFGCQIIAIVINPEGQRCLDQAIALFVDKLQIVVNYNPDRGRFSSVKTGLEALKNEPYVFLHNVDNPAVKPETLKLLFENLGSADLAIPCYEGKGGHPVLIKRELVHAILAHETEDLSLRNFFQDFKKSKINVDDPGVIVNLNTMNEFLEWKEKLGTQS